MIEGGIVIDFHGHPGRWGLTESSPKNLFNAMDAIGVDYSVLFNIWHPEGRRGNDNTAAMVAAHPDRIIGFAYVSPMMPDAVRHELERAIDALGFKAIKIYSPYTPYPLDDPAWDPVYGFADERGLAIIAHTGGEATSAPAQLGRAAPRFPNANFVAGHSGNAEPYRSQAIAAAQSCANYYLETCSTFRTPGVIEQLVAGAGAERVLFGSDTPLMDPRPQLGKIITAAINAEAKRLVLGENARRLLKL